MVEGLRSGDLVVEEWTDPVDSKKEVILGIYSVR